MYVKSQKTRYNIKTKVRLVLKSTLQCSFSKCRYAAASQKDITIENRTCRNSRRVIVYIYIENTPIYTLHNNKFHYFQLCAILVHKTDMSGKDHFDLNDRIPGRNDRHNVTTIFPVITSDRGCCVINFQSKIFIIDVSSEDDKVQAWLMLRLM